jgi:sugar phosphate isomerase/epimerase
LTNTSRRQFLAGSVAATLSAAWAVGIKAAWPGESGPRLRFPSQARERIAIASYPFRDFIAGSRDKAANNRKIALKDFAAHTTEKLNIRKIEPWSEHFLSLEDDYLRDIRAAVEKINGMIVNIAVDGQHSPYAANKTERQSSVAFSKRWVDVAAAIGSPSIRSNMPVAGDSDPDVERAASSLAEVVEHASEKNIVVNLENDNPVSEDPFFIVKVIEKVGSPWLHALPDFANTLTTGREEHAYSGVREMFGHAYNISHVKALEVNEQGQAFIVDMAKTFGMMKNANYKGYCSMEFDSPGDPYKGTAELIATTLRYLS